MREEIRRQVEHLLHSYDPEPEHVRQVARLAGRIFLGLASWHRLNPEHQEWLQVSALLHDIGWSQTSTGSKHHKHSARLIRAHAWEGFAPRTVNIIALVARYHRKAPPKSTHSDYISLSVDDRYVVNVLSGVLRVADALDRTHSSAVSDLSVSLGDQEIRLTITGRSACLAEIEMVERKKDLLERLSNRPVSVRHH